MSLQSELPTGGNVPASLSNAAKRDLITAELRKDASRSDREIARAVGHGICHKTVAAARSEISPADGKISTTPADGEMVLVKFLHGSVLMPADQARAVQSAMDQCTGAQLRALGGPPGRGERHR